MAHNSDGKRARVTIMDVARAAQVSTAAVSYYLNGQHHKLSAKTRQVIEGVIRDSGYVPNAQARTLSGKQTHVIAILILDNTNAWAGQFLAGVEEAALQHGYATVVCTSNFDTETELMYVEKMLAMGIDGFIVQPTQNFKAVSERITKTGTPLVFFDFNAYNLASTWIKTNLYDGVYSATTQLIEAGYQDFISIAADITTMRTRMERFQGFIDALVAQGQHYRSISIDHNQPSAEELTNYFQYELNPAHKTLLFVQNSWALNRVFKALQPLSHLIPNQIGLIGLNCEEWTDLVHPSISTITEPVREEGIQACEMLLEMLSDNPPEAQQRVLDCSVIWKDSTLHE
ncbi:LacI family DNA-binding transcriptional regulator [Collinsella sp. zg1085]|uniref:LacI family DNA-binding transcriptional regulator n=1 Tax=Collinsella sp. zg1085 TaxID=2844380 RepID=UPI001C0C7299|nr:LacI family DNA-binding transcriptional regulator [Collinsella sp. zg1085]QWT17412.1 LacI family DNA-binding transcriptional regulator [Collinsella sp. zg1085]